MKLKNKRILKTISVFLVFIMLAGVLSACSGKYSTRYKIDSLNIIESKSAGERYHLYNKDESIFVSQSGLIELYIDKAACAVAVKDTASGRTWYSLPAVAGFEPDASVISAVISDKNGNVYKMNSQDNSVAFGSASFESVDGGIAVTYRMAADKKTASSPVSKLEAGAPSVELTVNFTLLDGSFYVEIPASSISVPEDITLESVTVLDYLTSTTKVNEEDYIFIPDGCGALIKNAVEGGEKSYSVPVYADGEISAVVPAFGVKQTNAAYMALIEKGDCAAVINAYRGKDVSSSGRAGASFYISETEYDEDKNGSYEVYKGLALNDDIKISYRFLSGNSASYVSFSTACREMLIRNSVISVGSVSETENYPMFIDVNCAYSDNEKGTKTKVLTTFEEAEDILSQLKAKGVNNIYLNLKNSLDGADEQYDIEQAEFNSELGDENAYNSLYDYTKIQKMKLLIEVGILTSNRGSGGIAASESAKDIRGDRYLIEKEKPFADTAGDKKNTFRVLKPSVIDQKVAALLRNFREIPLSGYCVNDFGNLLLPDYSEGMSKEQLASEITQSNAALATERMLAVKKGNFNCIKSASIISRLPGTTGYKTSDAYEAVPFVQMVLHGTVDYTFEPINTQTDMKTAFLTCVEYGAIPSFEWFYQDSQSELLNSIYKFDNTVNYAAEFYARAEKLNYLRTLRIVDRSVPRSGVVLTEYSDGSKVYVNYNVKEVEVNDILIGAQDFVVIG